MDCVLVPARRTLEEVAAALTKGEGDVTHCRGPFPDVISSIPLICEVCMDTVLVMSSKGRRDVAVSGRRDRKILRRSPAKRSPPGSDQGNKATDNSGFTHCKQYTSHAHYALPPSFTYSFCNPFSFSIAVDSHGVFPVIRKYI